MAKQLNSESSSSSDSSDESSNSNDSNSSSNSSSSSSSSSSESETEADTDKVNKINIPASTEDAPKTEEANQDVVVQKDDNKEVSESKTEDVTAVAEEVAISDVPATEEERVADAPNKSDDPAIPGTDDNAEESTVEPGNQEETTVSQEKTFEGASVTEEKTSECASVTEEKTSEDASVTEEKTSEGASATEEKTSEGVSVVEEKTLESASAEKEKPPEEERKRKPTDDGPEDEVKRQKTAENKSAPDGEAGAKKKRGEADKSSKSKDPPASKEVSRRRSRDHSRSPDRRDRDKENRQRRQRSRSRSRDRRRRRSRSRSRDRGRDKSSDRRRNRSPNNKRDEPKEPENPSEKITERQRRTVDLLTSRTGGAYIPPAKLRLMQAEITDKSSAAYQRIAWEALKKSIHGYINKVNVDNIGIITRELLKENIVRGRGLLCRSIIQAQAASPTFTHVYAALVAIINSKFPNIGELLLKRLVIQFKRAFRRNDKAICLSASRFVAHLVNQRVAHEILALEILTLLVETPTDDSVEVAIAFLKECGMKLTEVSSKGIGAIFEMLKNILHEGKLDKRVQYMIEVVFQVRKDGFKDHQSVIEALELVEEDDQFTHLLMLDEATTTEDNLNAFKFDDKYETNEDKYKGLSKEILGSDASDSDEDGSGSGSDDSDSEEGEDETAKADAIIDNTETNLIALRRTIYLTINSSLDYEECAHKLMKMQLKPGQEIELCHMFLDCCAEQRTYEKFYGLLAQRFCSINKIYIEPFEEIFKDTYQTTHRLDTNRLRNVSKFFAHLLFTDAIGWDVLDCIKLNEDDTTSSSRIFIKILFQELAEYMGLGKLNEKLKDEVLTESLAGLFPKDNPRNTRFAINFFTSIGLGGLTDDLRQFLKNAPKNVPAINSEALPDKVEISSSSESSSSSSSESSSSSSDSESSESSSSDEKSKKKKKRKRLPVKKSSSSKQVSKKKKRRGEKKKESSSSESDSSSSDSSSSSNSSSSSESSSSSSEEEKKKRKKDKSKKAKVPPRKQSKSKDKKDVVVKKDKKKNREEKHEKAVNGKSENGIERDERRRHRDDRQYYEGGDRRDKRAERSPNRDRRHGHDYNRGSKRGGDHRAAGKPRNGSKERG